MQVRPGPALVWVLGLCSPLCSSRLNWTLRLRPEACIPGIELLKKLLYAVLLQSCLPSISNHWQPVLCFLLENILWMDSWQCIVIDFSHPTWLLRFHPVCVSVVHSLLLLISIGWIQFMYPFTYCWSSFGDPKESIKYFPTGFLHEHKWSFLLGKYLGMRLLGHRLDLSVSGGL